MRLLLDTHVLLWAAENDPRLSSRAREIIADATNETLFSAISALEIAIKSARRGIELPEPAATYVPSRIAAFSLEPLPVQVDHALQVAMLPNLHRDPFDRLLIAQAQVENLSILTSDQQIAQYDVQVIW
jgi:PIN domain nuclease of toxin-antitoxin system